ncbi:MAG: RHS repeat-associated core domain-containing protein [Novosphingobium sp.]
MASAPAYSFVHTGHLAEPLLVTDAAGAVVSSITRDPWGNAILLAGTAAIRLGYPGQWHDGTSGLYQNWHRDYDPTLGRYLETDPIGLAGGTNLYAYVDGNPVNAVDTEGLEKAIFFDPYKENSYWKGAMAEADIPGICLVYGHMNPEGLQIWIKGVSGLRRVLLRDPEDIHDKLIERGCKPQQPVYFLGCRAGQGKNSIAERYADSFHVRTVGSTQYTWWKQPRPNDKFWPYGYSGTSGKNGMGGRNKNENGQWRPFGP